VAKAKPSESAKPAEATDKPDKSAKKSDTLPSIEELVKKGSTVAEAHAGLVYKMARRCKMPDNDARAMALAIKEAFERAGATSAPSELKEPYYKVVACTPKGVFWRIGQQFSTTPSKVVKSSLTEEQVQELEGTDPKFLNVVLVTHE
jgi:hypothetical protein